MKRPHSRCVSVLVAVVVAVALAAVGCSDPGGARHVSEVHGRALHSAGLVVLKEDAAHFIGHPSALRIDSANGDVLAVDMFAKRILRFGRDGTFKHEYGGWEAGPGRLRGFLSDALVSDSSLVAEDSRYNQLVYFSLRTGRFLRRVALDRSQIYFSPAPRGMLFAGGPDSANGSMLTLWDVANDHRETLIPYDAVAAAAPVVSTAWIPHAISWSDSVLATLGASNKLYLLRRNGTALEVVEVPARLRRGIPSQRAINKPKVSGSMSGEISVAIALSRLPSRNFAVLYVDNSITSSGRTTRVWLSLLTPDLRMACVDAEVPVRSANMPMFAFRGDTLFALTQTIAGDMMAATTVQMLSIDSIGCRWLPTERRLTAARIATSAR